jgi:hypothetical protein
MVKAATPTNPPCKQFLFYTCVKYYISVQGSHLEQVVKVSRSAKPKGNSTEDQGAHAGSDEEPTEEQIEEENNEDHMHDDVGEQDVDRLIDADSNEYVLSRSKGGVALTLDPLLIQVLPSR